MNPQYPSSNDGNNSWGSGPELNFFDKQAMAYQDWMFVFHLFCCQCVGLFVGIILFLGCQTQEGKNQAGKLMAYSGLGIMIGFGLRVLLAAAKHR